jgi:NADH dehydrogenase FAD-containing subunit
MMDEVAINDHFINKAALVPALNKSGVEIFTGHKVLEIQKNGVRAAKKDGSEVFIEGDTIIASFGMVKNNKLAIAIDEKYHNKTRIIGDCTKVGKVGGAIRTGMYAGMTL